MLQRVPGPKLAIVSDSEYLIMGALGKVQQWQGMAWVGGGGGFVGWSLETYSTNGRCARATHALCRNAPNAFLICGLWQFRFLPPSRGSMFGALHLVMCCLVPRGVTDTTGNRHKARLPFLLMLRDKLPLSSLAPCTTAFPSC